MTMLYTPQMKKNQQRFSITEQNVIFKLNRKKNIKFDDCQKIVYDARKNVSPEKFNIINVSKELFSVYNKDRVLLIKECGNEYINVELVLNKDLNGNEFLATKYVAEKLLLQNGDNVIICRYNDITISKLDIQNIDNIRENKLVVSAKDIDMHQWNLKDFKLYEVYNSFTGDSLVVKASHIIEDEHLEAGTMKLNRKQRIALGAELPLCISPEQWDVLVEQLDDKGKALLTELYMSDSHILDENVCYEKQTAFLKIIKPIFCKQLKIIPVLESANIKSRSLIKTLCDFYVGKSTMSLIVKRPLANDEGLDVVRMTKSNMNLLGIDEMDKVILQYKNKKIRCRVLEIDNEELFFKTNRPAPIELSIGVPVHLRKKLGIVDLASSIKVDRDTAFIFKKSVNEQIVPIILTLFSTSLFSDASVILSVILSLVAIPIVLYLNLSSKRNMRT